MQHNRTVAPIASGSCGCQKLRRAQNTAEHIYVRKIQQTLFHVKIQPLTWEVQKAWIA